MVPDKNLHQAPAPGFHGSLQGLSKNLFIWEERKIHQPFRTDSMVYAYVDSLMIGALDFHQIKKYIQINTIYVKPDFRGYGIGTALAKYLLVRYADCRIEWAAAANAPSTLRKIFRTTPL